MGLTDEGSGIPATMLVGPTGYAGGMPYPVYQGGNSGNNGWGDGNGWWIILLFILLAGNGGWGNNGFAGCGNNGGVGSLYPWMNQAEITTGGFQNAATNSAISSLQNSVTSGFGDVQNALCSGFAGVNAGIANGFAQAEIADNARQMANMNQIFGLSSQFADCCCENRLGLANLGADIAREACADRAAVSDALRDVIAANTASTQRILDQMCADKIDAKNEKIAELQNQLNMATLRESQTAQNAFIQNGLTNEVDALYNRMSSCPIPTVPVYGRQPIFSCNGNCGCGGNGLY